MIAKKYRFHGYGALKFVYTKGKTVRARFVSLKFHENTRRTESRLAVVVPKKVAKKAPERNRIRRRIYEAMRVNWDSIKTPHDLVITVFDEKMASISVEELTRIIKDLIRQANLTSSKR